MNVFQGLNQIMSSNSNFKVFLLPFILLLFYILSTQTYRELLKSETQPRVPYLGRYLTDLVFVEEAMPLVLADGLVHFWKCRMISQIVSIFVRSRHIFNDTCGYLISHRTKNNLIRSK